MNACSGKPKPEVKHKEKGRQNNKLKQVQEGDAQTVKQCKIWTWNPAI